MGIKGLVRRALLVVFPDRQFISLLKWELKLLAIHIYSKLSPIEWIKVGSLRKGKDLKVNIGNGPFRHEGWVNLDCRLSRKKEDPVCDLRRRWPLRNASAKYIFAEHVFEHFEYPDGIEHILRECHRALQLGGVLRIILPNAEKYLVAYANSNHLFLEQMGVGITPKMAVINKVFRENGFHRFAYDYEMMKSMLEKTGFIEIYQSSFRESRCQDLNLDLDEPERRLESLYIEAVR